MVTVSSITFLVSEGKFDRLIYKLTTVTNYQAYQIYITCIRLSEVVSFYCMVICHLHCYN